MSARDGRAVARTLAWNAGAGAAAGLAVLVALLVSDVGGIATLLGSDPQGPLLVVAMALLFAAGFAVLAFATGLFLLPPAGTPAAARTVLAAPPRPRPAHLPRTRR